MTMPIHVGGDRTASLSRRPGSLTPGQRRYVAVETGIGAVINAVLSMVFVFLVFGGRTSVPVFGTDGLVLDAVPQTLMVSLMSMLVPGMLTCKRLLDGKVAGASPPTVGAVVRRSIVVALLLAGVLTGVQFLLLRLGPPSYPFGNVLVGKMLYGAVLGAAIARYGVRLLLVGPRP